MWRWHLLLSVVFLHVAGFSSAQELTLVVENARVIVGDMTSLPRSDEDLDVCVGEELPTRLWAYREAGKLAASLMTFEAADGAKASARAGQDFACTQVLGFSQSLEWFGGLSLADHTPEGREPESPSLDAPAFLPTWQGRFYMGAAVEAWMDPGYPGWSGTHARARETPAHCNRDEVDRVVFNVSGAARSPDAWAEAVDSVSALVRAKFPAVRRVVMQPVVGAPEGECRDVRAARNHPVIAEGIRRAAERGAVTAGPEPKVTACDQFRDDLGHLTREGAEHVRVVLREHYRDSTALPDDEGDSEGAAK